MMKLSITTIFRMVKMTWVPLLFLWLVAWTSVSRINNADAISFCMLAPTPSGKIEDA